MPEMMTGNSETGLAGIIFHTFLNAAYGDGLSGKRPFLHQKNFFHFVRWSHPEIFQESMKGIVTHVDHSIFSSLAILDQDSPAVEVYDL